MRPFRPTRPLKNAMTARGPEALGEILSRLFTARGWGRRQSQLRLEDAWRTAVGAEQGLAQAATRVGGLRRGVLEIVVEDAVLLQELAHYHKRRLLTALAEQLPGTRITDLRFRLGKVHGDS